MKGLVPIANHSPCIIRFSRQAGACPLVRIPVRFVANPAVVKGEGVQFRRSVVAVTSWGLLIKITWHLIFQWVRTSTTLITHECRYVWMRWIYCLVFLCHQEELVLERVQPVAKNKELTLVAEHECSSSFISDFLWRKYVTFSSQINLILLLQEIYWNFLKYDLLQNVLIRLYKY